MKTKDIAKKYGLDSSSSAFDRWLRQSGRPHKSGMTGLSIDDSVNTDELVGAFKQYVAQERYAPSRSAAQASRQLKLRPLR